MTHWLGALITSRAIIGTRGITPVRALIDAAAALVPGERHALCAVVDHATGGLHSLSFGEPERGLGGRRRGRRARHPRRVPPAPVQRVLSLVPPATPTCGPVPRASTRSSRSSPTAVRSCSTRRTSPRSPPCTQARRASAITAATSSWPLGRVPRSPPRGTRALDAPLRGRDVRPRSRRAPTGPGDARNRYPRSDGAARISAISTPAQSTSTWAADPSARGPRRRRGPLPPSVGLYSPSRGQSLSFSGKNQADLVADRVERVGEVHRLVQRHDWTLGLPRPGSGAPRRSRSAARCPRTSVDAFYAGRGCDGDRIRAVHQRRKIDDALRPRDAGGTRHADPDGRLDHAQPSLGAMQQRGDHPSTPVSPTTPSDTTRSIGPRTRVQS